MQYYEVLEVSKEATAEEISKAYRLKAIRYHPDKNSDPKAIEIFKKCAEAYEILSDPVKRSQYDFQGYVGRRPHNWKPSSNPKPQKKAKTADDFRREQQDKDFWSKQKQNPEKSALDSINCSFFGGETTGRNIMTHLHLTPSELHDGGRFLVRVKRREWCSRCIGDGLEKAPCPACNSAYMRRDDPNRMLNMHCPRCDGAEYIEVQCKNCNGEGVNRWMIHEFMALVPPRSAAGQHVRVIGEGEHAPKKIPGYVQVVLIEKVT